MKRRYTAISYLRLFVPCKRCQNKACILSTVKMFCLRIWPLWKVGTSWPTLEAIPPDWGPLWALKYGHKTFTASFPFGLFWIPSLFLTCTLFLPLAVKRSSLEFLKSKAVRAWLPIQGFIQGAIHRERLQGGGRSPKIKHFCGQIENADKRGGRILKPKKFLPTQKLWEGEYLLKPLFQQWGRCL